MSNSILNRNVGESNTMPSLSFIWTAIFLNGETIFQFDENNIEHRFQEVKDRFNELKYFSIYNKNTNQKFEVDLEKGLVYNNKISFSESDLKEVKKNIRLIFFRRHRIELSNNLEEKNHTIIYFLGYQYLDNNGNNIKIILQIDENGNFLLGG